MKKVFALVLAIATTLPLLTGCNTAGATPTTSFAPLPIITTEATEAALEAIDTTAAPTQTETTPIGVPEDFIDYTNYAYELTMKIPKGFEVKESDLHHVRLESSDTDQTNITILAAVGDVLGIYDEREIKNLYWLRSELLRLTVGGIEYELFETAIAKTFDPLVIGDITFYQTENSVDYYDSKSMSQLVQPYNKVFYFFIDKNAYILNITCPPENMEQWDEIAMQMISSIKKPEPALIEFTQDNVVQYQSKTLGISFAYPKDYAFVSGLDRIVFRKNTDPSDPLYGIQITMLPGSATFTDKDKAAEQLVGVIGASYAAEDPLTKLDNVAARNSVNATGVISLASGQECTYFDLLTIVVAGKGGLGTFVDAGNIESRLYSFTTADGSVCAINISYPKSGKEAAAKVMELVEKTLTIS